MMTFFRYLLLALLTTGLMSDAYGKDERYLFQMPEWREASGDYKASIVAYAAHVTMQKDGRVLINPNRSTLRWVHRNEATGEPEVGWLGSVKKNGDVAIEGIWGKGEAVAHVQLHGISIGRNSWKGTARVSIGTDPSAEVFPMHYEMEWSLSPQRLLKPPEISQQVRNLAPEPKQMHVSVEAPAQDDLVNRPPINPLTIKGISHAEGALREKLITRQSKAARQYLASLLEELTWDEIKHFPGIILLLDHLAKLDQTAQQRTAQAYVRDGTANFFDGLPLDKLQKVPPHMLLVICRDKMNKADIDSLEKVSPKSRDILEIASRIQEDPTTSAGIEELVAQVLDKTPPAECKKYLRNSAKLRNLISTSQNNRLKKFLPFPQIESR